MRRWVAALVVLGWVGLVPGVLISLAAREDSDARLELSWLVWAGYYVAVVVGIALWRLVGDREVDGSAQRKAASIAVLLGVSVPVVAYVAVVAVTTDPRPDGLVSGGAIALVVFTITAWALAMLGTFVGRLLTRSTQPRQPSPR